MNQVPYIQTDTSITIFWDGKPHTIRQENVNFNEVRKALLDARYEDLGDLLDIEKAIENFIQGDIEVNDEVVYYKGHRLHGVVVDKLLGMLRQGAKDSAPIVNFITRLQANPSANSVAELYTFLGYKSLPTTPEGKVLGYKGVQSNYFSSTGNADTIVVQGETNGNHQILNQVGSTIEVARRSVDDNKDNHCSFGLHVGSFDYASNWSGQDGKLLLVEFDPADAVSVPTDCDFQKLRVSKYKVIADITDQKKELDKPVYEANKPIYNSDSDDYVDGEDYDEEDYVDCDDDYVDGEDDISEGYASGGLGASVPTDAVPEGYASGSLGASVPTDAELNQSIVKYLNKKRKKGEDVTLKGLADLTAPRSRNLKCADLVDILEDLGYEVEHDESIPLYLHKVI
jgi:hypothetical protein